jgi:hypothetical protein
MGMQKDLGLTIQQFYNILMMFCEPPTSELTVLATDPLKFLDTWSLSCPLACYFEFAILVMLSAEQRLRSG